MAQQSVATTPSDEQEGSARLSLTRFIYPMMLCDQDCEIRVAALDLLVLSGIAVESAVSQEIPDTSGE